MEYNPLTIVFYTSHDMWTMTYHKISTSINTLLCKRSNKLWGIMFIRTCKLVRVHTYYDDICGVS